MKKKSFNCLEFKKYLIAKLAYSEKIIGGRSSNNCTIDTFTTCNTHPTATTSGGPACVKTLKNDDDNIDENNNTTTYPYTS